MKKDYILICENFWGEAEAAKQLLDNQDVDIQPYPCTCCAHKQKTGILENLISRQKKKGIPTVIVGGQCLSAVQALADEKCQLYPLEQCFQMITDPGVVDSYLAEGAYLITSGWLVNWRKHIEPWGFNEETIKIYFNESVKKLVLLDTRIDENSLNRLKEFSHYTGLKYQVVPVGLSHFSLFLNQIILKRRLLSIPSQPALSDDKPEQVAANYAMALDLLVGLTKVKEESQVIQSILEIFQMLFAPGYVEYVQWNDDRPGEKVTWPEDSPEDNHLREWLSASYKNQAWLETETGFYLRIKSMNRIIGGISIQSIAFAEYKHPYLNLAVQVTSLCGLAIMNARTYQLIKTLNAELELRVEERTADLMASNQQLMEESIERQRAVEALQESESRYHSVVSAMTEGVILAGINGIIVTCNESAGQILNLPDDRIIGCHIQNLPWFATGDGGAPLPAESNPMVRSLYNGLPSLGINMSIRKPNGHLSWVSVNAQPLIHSRDKRPYGVVCSFSDITDRKHKEEQIKNQIERLSTLRTIDQAILCSLDLNVVFRTILTDTITRLGVDAADILLLDPLKNELEFIAGKGFQTNIIESTRLRVGEGFAGRAALERKSVHVDNLNECPGGFSRLQMAEKEHFIDYYGVPLLAKGQLVGLLEVFHRKKIIREADWLDFLETLAGQTAIAVENGTLFSNLQTSNLELQQAYETTLEGWSHALDLRDKETKGHTQRVTNMTEHLARSMGIEEDDLIDIRRGALLHDIGKMGVPDHILLKPGKLTDEEWQIMKTHPQKAYDLLSPIAYLHKALDIPYCHHEKWDGSGYPRGLSGDRIPKAARIFAVIDVFDAVTSDRPYRNAWPKEKAIQYIRDLSGTHFEPQVVLSFLDVFSNLESSAYLPQI